MIIMRFDYNQTDEYGPLLSTFDASGLEHQNGGYYRLLIRVNEYAEESILINHAAFYSLMERFSFAQAGDELLGGESVTLNLNTEVAHDFIEGILNLSNTQEETIAGIPRFQGKQLLIVGAVADDGGGEISAVLRIAEDYLTQNSSDRVNVILLSTESKKNTPVILQAEASLKKRCYRVYSMVGDGIDYYGSMNGPGRMSLPADRKKFIQLYHEASFVINARPWIGDLSIPYQSGMVRLKNRWMTPQLCLTDLGGGGSSIWLSFCCWR